MVLQAGKMYRPTAVAFDILTNSVFVVEQFNHRISKWDYTDTNYDFTLDTTWGDKNPTDGTLGGPGPVISTTDSNFYRPTGIVFDVTNTLLYVTDTFHNRVRVIDPTGTGTFDTSIGTGGFGDTDFYRPAGIAIETDTDGSVVIADELNHRAVRYTTNGTTLVFNAVLADPSDTSGLSFVRPHGVVYDVTDDSFNIGDSLRSVISSYTEAGAFVNQFGTPGTTGTDLFFPGSGHGLLGGTATTVIGDTRNNILKTMNNEVIANATGTIAGTGNGELYYPESATAAVDGANYVLAANTLNNRVEIFSSSGAVLTSEDPFNFGKPTP